MTQNDAEKTHKCAFCLYCSKRRFDLKRHHNAKHKDKIFENNGSEQIVQNVIPNVQNVIPNVQNVIPNVQNVILKTFSCSKCNKIYKTLRHLHNHETNCNKVDSLTCPRCMISFTNRHNKNRHIKADKCKARSIIHARAPNIQNITNNNTTNNIQNAETIQNINNANRIIINNFGSERIDHISDEDIMKILQSGTNTVPLYIKKKHFDKNFPENNNIKYSNDNKCQVLEDNCWQEKDIGLLSTNLMKDNTEVLLMYCDNNEIQLLNEIDDIEKYEHIRNKLFIVYNKSDNQRYNAVLTKIKELIKSSTVEIET
jgi:hypothetical protein